MTGYRASVRRTAGLAALAVTILTATGCQSSAFRTEADASFVVGTVPPAAAEPGDRLVGQAANEPGRCIYARTDGRRFRQTCPDGFDL